jgi:SAM-dependent methyltransferase
MGLTAAQKVRRALKQYGFAATVWVVIRNVAVRIGSFLPWTEWRRYRQGVFDRRFGIETTTPVDRTDLDIPVDLIDNIVRYDPIPVEGFRRMLGDLQIDYSAYSFIDLGAGKGRALLLASDLPFLQIIGVEISRELSEVATRNIGTYRSPNQRCREIRCVCTDAAEFEFPDGPLFVYLYNPFHLEILTTVMARLERSLRDSPRSIVLAYVNPAYRAYLDHIPWLRRLRQGSFYNEYLRTNHNYLIYELDHGGLQRVCGVSS